MEPFDYSALRFWLDVLVIVAVVGNTFYTWMVNRSKVNASSIRAVKKECHEIKDRVTLLENEVKHLPSDNDIGNIHRRIDDVSGQIKTMAGEFKGVKGTLDLIHTWLIEHGRGT